MLIICFMLLFTQIKIENYFTNILEKSRTQRLTVDVFLNSCTHLIFVVMLASTLVEFLLQSALRLSQSLLVYVPHVTDALAVLEQTAHLT